MERRNGNRDTDTESKQEERKFVGGKQITSPWCEVCEITVSARTQATGTHTQPQAHTQRRAGYTVYLAVFLAIGEQMFGLDWTHNTASERAEEGRDRTKVASRRSEEVSERRA